MKQKYFLKLFTVAFMFMLPLGMMAQTVKGKVTDSSGEGLPYMNIVEKGNSSNGIVSDENGNFSITLKSIPGTIVVSSMGYKTTSVNVKDSSFLTITINEDNALNEVVITGNRTKPRTILDSPVPIDNIDVADLVKSGKPTLDRMLTFKVPSFNSQNQAISDATAHYDPADLRGLGPSRTLVLINGKRKNQSAQVYLNRTPGKGEVGVDLKSIPTAAIERVEVLRDGASAIYGSDAIAGVMNIILKKDVEYSTFTSSAGITSQEDGFNFSSDFNTAFTFGNGGFVNLTLGYYKQAITNRAGLVPSSDAGAAPTARDAAWLAANPTANMTVGQPEMEKRDFMVNMEHPLGEESTLYSFHGLTTRNGKSFAYYRAPYWRNDVANANFITRDPADFIGYQPTFETKINDHINALGIRFPLAEGWNADASVTYGSNDVDVTVNNSVNRDYLADHGTSPRSFNPGGYTFTNVVGNLDINTQLSDAVGLAFGVEFKNESFKANEGNPLSYYGAGSDSFAGIKPDEAGKWSRNNLGLYTQLDYDVSEKLLLGVAGRYEDYTDAGSNFSWKANGRYKLGENGALRASYSTGFRAPTLHQSHITLSQYIIVAGSSEPLLQGTLANDNPAVQALGVPSLTHEISKNLSAGLTYKFDRNFSASIDFYQIKVDDRVLFSSQIGYKNGAPPSGAIPAVVTNPVEQVLADNNVVAVQMFINAGDTKTTGADVVLNYRNIEMGENARLHTTLAANFNKTTLDAINTPSILDNAGYNIFDRQEQGLITNSRPRSKMILGLNLVTDKWDIAFNNSRFGEVTVTAPESGGTDQELAAKITTDLGLGYKLTDMITFNANINNIFDVYPDVTLASTQTAQAGSRFQYSSEVQQLGQLGTNFSIGINVQF